MVYIIIIGCIAAVALFLIYLFSDDSGTYNEGIIVINLFLWTTVLIVALAAFHKPEVPSALDVYRGNTELEIHSANGVPTDTIVVYKKKQL